MRIERLSIGEDYDAMKLYRPAGLRTADPKRPDWTRDHGYAQTSEFPFPDLYLHESVADLAETDPAFPAFLEECLENFTCHEYGHLSSMDQVENFLSRDLRKENTWMQGNYPSENWGEVHLEICYDQGLFHRLEKAPRDLALAQQKKEREAAQ